MKDRLEGYVTEALGELGITDVAFTTASEERVENSDFTQRPSDDVDKGVPFTLEHPADMAHNAAMVSVEIMSKLNFDIVLPHP